MKMTQKWIILAISLFVIPSTSKALTGSEIMRMVDDRPNGEDQKMVMEMTLINKKGKKRVRQMIYYSKDYGKDVKSIFYFKKPADVKGVGFLTWGYDNPEKDDDRWLYLPALKRSKRISGTSKNDYFMGSDLTYDDMGDRSVEEDVHQVLKEEKMDGMSCWVIESVSKDKDYMYGKVIQWIRKDALIRIKSEYYDKKNRLIKVMIKRNISQPNGFWTAYLTEVENVKDQHKTVLEIKEVTFNLKMKDALFMVSTLERGRL